MLTGQDFLADRTADGELLFTFSNNILDFRRSLSSCLIFGSRNKDFPRFCHLQLYFPKSDQDGVCNWPKNRLQSGRGSERPAAHAQQTLTQVPPPPPPDPSFSPTFNISPSLRSWWRCVGARLKFWRRSRVFADTIFLHGRRSHYICQGVEQLCELTSEISSIL